MNRVIDRIKTGPVISVLIIEISRVDNGNMFE